MITQHATTQNKHGDTAWVRSVLVHPGIICRSRSQLIVVYDVSCCVSGNNADLHILAGFGISMAISCGADRSSSQVIKLRNSHPESAEPEGIYHA